MACRGCRRFRPCRPAVQRGWRRGRRKTVAVVADNGSLSALLARLRGIGGFGRAWPKKPSASDEGTHARRREGMRMRRRRRRAQGGKNTVPCGIPRPFGDRTRAVERALSAPEPPKRGGGTVARRSRGGSDIPPPPTNIPRRKGRHPPLYHLRVPFRKRQGSTARAVLAIAVVVDDALKVEFRATPQLDEDMLSSRRFGRSIN